LCASSFVPFARCVTAENIVVGELNWCLAIRSCTNWDCEIAFVELWGVWETYELALGRGGLVGVGVCNLILSFDRIAWGLYRTSLEL